MPASRARGANRFSFSRRPSEPTSGLIKPGIYGAPSPSPRSVTFAPNVTPGTYTESDDLLGASASPEPSLPTNAQLFPPSEEPPNPPVRRRAPPGKRRSLGYIPRPPNAFMLFRADFVRQKHVPGSIETNHGSLSKIIGNCWRALPLEEKRVWEIKAKQEKDEHSKKHPGYRFKPVHNKNKDKKKEKAPVTPEDERRCEQVAQFLLEGKKGDELAAAIRELDGQKFPAATPAHGYSGMYPPRRPSSVPLPDSRFHAIALPSVPFFAAGSRAESPVNNISRSARMIIGQRRPSSALPHVGRSTWGFDDVPMFPASTYCYPSSSSLQRDESPLPEVDTSLFEPSFLDSNFGFQAPVADPTIQNFEFFSGLPPHAHSPADYGIAPLDHISPQDLPLQTGRGPRFDMSNPASNWGVPLEFSHSQPSSTYSGSPARSDLSLPLVAPRPQHATAPFDMWQDMSAQQQHFQASGMTDKISPAVQNLSASLSHQHISSPIDADQQIHLANYTAGLESLFDGSFTGMEGMDAGAIGFDY
ncbi:hypothetical protein HYDPIDRAFT_170519 [Hydnomerulius pinastri MD-312]|uniref:HMG box domain-containing protein n=1 Tax=Hydnomerulius pinastri MD-312 TaxID=994086 RepID=A0A0C9WA56_9AGAM|nr:hypothetical protein HYDPIDRAFT_170519 [Hydnomerulius pinastri MD-312]